MTDLSILYKDEYLVAINKPSGLLVHRSWIDKEATEFALQKTRDLIGQYVYPVHRLDRPTSGVLLMALSPEIAKLVGQSFEQRLTQKQYLAVTRGYIADEGEVDYPLVEKLDKIADRKASKEPEAKSAFTAYQRLATSELPICINRYPNSRFSLVRLYPREGRKHQIRRHLAHLRYPILGDVNYGDNKYNRYLRNEIVDFRLALHAEQLCLPHPVSNEKLCIKAPIDDSFKQILSFTQLHY